MATFRVTISVKEFQVTANCPKGKVFESDSQVQWNAAITKVITKEWELIGSKYKDDCPVQNLIPIYLIVSGAASLFASCCTCGFRYKRGDQEERRVDPLQGIVQIFLFAWFICGNVWIYGIFEPNYSDPTSVDFCNKTLYLFAFWATTAYYIVLGITMVISCGVSFFVSCAAAAE